MIGLCLGIIAQILMWFQINSQFVWPEIKKYNLLLIIVGGSIISYLFLNSVKYIVEGFDGQVWSGRLVPAATGMVVFSAMTWLFMKQGIDMKTGVCLLLSLAILLIQFFWK